MNCEKDVKKRVKEILNSMGIWWYMHVPSGYGANGIPDFVCCYQGMFLAIETKFGGGKLSPVQRHQADAIEKAKGVFLLIDEHNVEDLQHLIETACS